MDSETERDAEAEELTRRIDAALALVGDDEEARELAAECRRRLALEDW